MSKKKGTLRDAVGKDKLGWIDGAHHRHKRRRGTDAYVVCGCHGIVVMVKSVNIQSLHSNRAASNNKQQCYLTKSKLCDGIAQAKSLLTVLFNESARRLTLDECVSE